MKTPTPSGIEKARSRMAQQACNSVAARVQPVDGSLLASQKNGCAESPNSARVPTPCIGNSVLGVSAEKRCSACKQIKPRDAFGLRAITSDGLMSACRACRSIQVAASASKAGAKEKRKASDAARRKQIRATPEGREQIRLEKEKSRRQKGAKPRPALSVKAQKKLERSALAPKNCSHSAHVTAWANRSWDYRSDEYKTRKTAIALARRQRQKKSFDIAYVRRLMAKNSALRHGDIPLALVEAKQIQLQIAKFINQLEMKNEKR